MKFLGITWAGDNNNEGFFKKLRSAMNVTGTVNEPDSQTQNIVSYDQIKIKIDGGHVWVRFLLSGEEQAQVNGPMIGPNSGEPTINITIGAEGSVRSKP